MTLVRFTTSGSGPRRAVHQSPTVRVFGATHFVSAGSTGGILAGCFSGRPCRITTTITARGTVIARTGGEFLGTNELGYLSFRLSTQGRAMLAAAPGNQLGAHVTLTSGSASASADIALVRF
jgi:hypothetical protein